MSFGAFQKPNVGGLGAGVRPMPEMAGMAKAGTAVSGLQTGTGPLMGLQNVPLTDDFSFEDFRAGNVDPKLSGKYGALAGVHPSGYHPSWESGYGITGGSVSEDGTYRGTFLDAEGRLNKSGYKPAETFTTSELKELQVEYDRQEAIRQNKLNKLQELATMGDDRQATAPRPQMVGAGSGMRNFQPIASGPLKRPDDILNTPFLQGLYS